MSLETTLHDGTATPTAKDVVDCTKTSELMVQMLSSQSEFFSPTSGWLKCRELQLKPDLWHVTLEHWNSTWREHRMKRQQASSSSPTVMEPETDAPPSAPTLLSHKALEMVRAKYGTHDPYAWSPLATQADEQESPFASEELSEDAHDTEIPEHPDGPPGACSSSLEVIPFSNHEALLALCAVEVPSSRHAEVEPFAASDDQHARILDVNDREGLHQKLKDYSSTRMVVEAGYAARRKRSRMPTQPVEDIPGHPVSANRRIHRPLKHTEGFVVKSVRRFSLSNQEEISAYTPSSKDGLGSLWKTVGRIGCVSKHRGGS